ncbi:MAG: heme exporter protein CcmB [Pseudomonadota bacterium]|nr:heme exporter protein CcmB [Pseudomonadota bacterium]
MKMELAFFHWELKAAFRNGGAIINSLVFFVIVIFLFPLSLNSDLKLLGSVAPALLWIAALLAVLLTLDRFFIDDIEDGTLEFLTLSRLPLETIALIKIITHWITTGLPITLISPVLGFMLNLPPQTYSWILLSTLIGTPALSCLGALSASLLIGIPRGSLLLCILALPFYFPTLIIGTRLVYSVINSYDTSTPIAFLAACTLFSLAICPFICAKVIKTHWKYS